MQHKKVDRANTPEKFSKLKKTEPKTTAVGMGSLKAVWNQVNTYMDKGKVLKVVSAMNQKGGFDCPGCAWPDPDDERATMAEYCENGIKAMAEEVQNKTIGLPFFQQYSIDELAAKSDFEIGKSGRLSEPLYLPPNGSHYEAISWESAFDKIAEHLRGLDNPDEAIFYTSGRTTNEAAFLYQLFVREFGTNNLPDCSNMCHEASGTALSETVGIGKGSVTLDDLYKADLVMVIGQNPGTNHPRMLSALEKCKENNGKIMTINPLPEAGLTTFINPQRPMKMLGGGTQLTDLFLPVKINGDVALLKAIMLKMLEKEESEGGVFDKAFIHEKTAGYDTFIADLKKYNFEDCVKASGLSQRQVEEAAEMIMQNERIIICWAMGLTQHENGVDNIREVVNLLLLKGSIGKPGAGTCPVRGHSNVQGDRTMGIWEAPPEKLLHSIEKAFGFTPPTSHGYSVIDAIKAMYEKKGRVFFGLGGNFLSAAPDTNYTAAGLQNCDLTVHVSTKLNRSHLVTGKEAIILPVLGRAEKDVQQSGEQIQSVENSMGVVHATKGILDPCSDKLRSEVSVVANIAAKTLEGKTKVDWLKYIDDYSHIRTDIEKVIGGFEDYNKRLENKSGFYLPNGPREGNFTNKIGKALFTVNKMPEKKLLQGELMMMTIRSHDQFNTTIYGMDDRYRGIYNERRVVLMNAADMETQGIREKEVVNLKSVFKDVTREANNFIALSYPIPVGCCATYYPETNVLVPIDQFAHTAKTPASKSVVITLEKK
jgi:molybdopterin-dependent oxidoreductase alpha subunit